MPETPTGQKPARTRDYYRMLNKSELLDLVRNAVPSDNTDWREVAIVLAERWARDPYW